MDAVRTIAADQPSASLPGPRAATIPAFKSLRWRVIALIVSSIVLPGSWYVYDAFARAERELAIALEGGWRQVQEVASADGFILGTIKRELEVLAAQPDIAGIRHPNCAEILAKILKRSSDIVQVSVFEPDGDGRCMAPTLAVPEGARPAEWPDRVRDSRKFTVVAPYFSALAGERVIAFALPVPEEDGQARRIVALAYRLQFINAALARLPRPPGSAITLFQDDGVVLARAPDGEKFAGRNIRDTGSGAALDLARRVGQGTIESVGFDGVKRVAVFVPFGDRSTGMYLGLSFNKDSFAAAARGTLFIALGQLFVLVAIAVGLLWFAMNGVLLRPLALLQQRVRAFAAGQPPGAPAGGRGEIAALERDFDAMMAAIDAQRGALRESARMLEARVEERTRALAETNAELEAYAHIVAHNLRAPMRQIAAYAANLIEDHGRLLPEGARTTAERMAAAAGRVEDSLSALHAFIRGAGPDFARAPVDLDQVVASALQQLALAPDVAEVTVRRPLGRVCAHAEALRQAVASLLANAAKYVEPGAKAAIEVSSETLGARRRLWIEDKGIGIAPQHHERIFKMFERLHGDEAYAGTGAGLALAQRAVRRMGGTIGVESRLGAGSRFWIELAAADGPAEPGNAGT